MFKALAMTDGPLCMSTFMQNERLTLNVMMKWNHFACILHYSVV